MSLLYPFLNILGETLGKVYDKLALKAGANYKAVLIIVIGFMMLFTTIFLVVTGQEFPALSLGVIALVLLMIILSTVQNLSDTKGLSMQALSVREPIYNFVPLLGSFIAFLLFPAERNPLLLIFVLIGSATLFWANFEAHHLQLFSNPGTRYFLIAGTGSAFLWVIYKQGLESLSPAMLFFFRMIGVFIVLALFFNADLRQVTTKQWGFLLGAGIVYFFGSLMKLYAISTLGLLQTILIVMLEPTIKYFSAFFFLNEQVKWKQMISSAILITLVILSITL